MTSPSDNNKCILKEKQTNAYSLFSPLLRLHPHHPKEKEKKYRLTYLTSKNQGPVFEWHHPSSNSKPALLKVTCSQQTENKSSISQNPWRTNLRHSLSGICLLLSRLGISNFWYWRIKSSFDFRTLWKSFTKSNTDERWRCRWRLKAEGSCACMLAARNRSEPTTEDSFNLMVG